jgi:hypothetical protein
MIFTLHHLRDALLCFAAAWVILLPVAALAHYHKQQIAEANEKKKVFVAKCELAGRFIHVVNDGSELVCATFPQAQ